MNYAKLLASYLCLLLFQSLPNFTYQQTILLARAVQDGLGLAWAFVVAECERERTRRREELREKPHPDIGGERITKEWLTSLPDRDAIWRFRFTASQLMELADALELPEQIVTNGRHRFNKLEALALTCARFRSAGDQHELSLVYNRSQAAISEVVNWVVIFVDTKWKHLLDFDHTRLLSPVNLERYAEAIYRRGAPVRSVWGFIDCTIRPICHPHLHQSVAYSGHKKYHALKFQAVVLPNGMFGHLHGPEVGRHNDNHLLHDSGLLEMCAQHAVRHGTDEQTPGEQRFLQIFGDPAYGLSWQILSPFSGPGERTPDEKEWNEVMAGLRIEVEHGFGIVANNWQFLNAGWKMQVFSSPVGRYYRVGVLFTNALNCFHPNQIAQYFDCFPPELREYFHH